MKVFEIYRPILGYGPEELQALAAKLTKRFDLYGKTTQLHWGNIPRMSLFRASDALATALNEHIEAIGHAAANGLNGEISYPSMRLWGFDLPPFRVCGGINNDSTPRVEIAEVFGNTSGTGSSSNEALFRAVRDVSGQVINTRNRGAFRGDLRNLERGVVNNAVLLGMGREGPVIGREDLRAAASPRTGVRLPKIELGPVEISFSEIDDHKRYEILNNYGYLA